MPNRKTNKYNVFIGLGSNIGNRSDFLDRALALLEEKVGCILRQSSVYETEPWGVKEQDLFLNMIVLLESKRSPWQLLSDLQLIEKKLEKKKIMKWGPRTIDLDIIYFDKKIIFEKDLIIPHPNMYLRNFVLAPLMEIAPDLLHPILNIKTKSLFEGCPDKSEIKRIKPNTAS